MALVAWVKEWQHGTSLKVNVCLQQVTVEVTNCITNVFRYMYVTSRKTNRGRIIRYQMDGKNETALVASGLSKPNGLDIDFKSESSLFATSLPLIIYQGLCYVNAMSTVNVFYAE